MQNDMIDFIERHQIKPIIDKRFSFENIENAFRHQESGKHFGKIVLEW
jgi:NADPH:quinone reductase-like Zn-dependent oxidoreductase